MRVAYKDPVMILQGYEEIDRKDKEGCANLVYSKDQRLYHISVPLVDGKLQGDAEMVCLGKVVASLSYKCNQINGECILYYENGRQMEIVQVVNGWKKGKYTLYNRDGKAIEKGFYSKDRTAFHTAHLLVEDNDNNNNERNNRQRNNSPDDNMKKYTTTALIVSALVIAGRMVLRSRL